MQPDARQAHELRQLAKTYLALASGLLRPAPPVLIAVGGFSGSGKSTVALALAPDIGAAPGAVVLRSDAIRKQLLGVPELDRLGPEGYTVDISARVYATMLDRATSAVAGGQSVIADAVFARGADRHAIERVAADAGVPFNGVWLEAPSTMLIDRAERRVADPSDADAAVIRQQRTQEIGAMRWHRIDASRPFEDVLKDARSELTAVAASSGRAD
jgi:predicted kinase